MRARVVPGSRSGPDWKALRERVDLAAVAANLLGPGTREGGRIKWCCPFHEESGPSFKVKPGESWFRCYGCGESGDAANLVMRCRGASFPEAVAWLADFTGLTPVSSGQGTAKPAALRRERPGPLPAKPPGKRQEGPSGLALADALSLAERAAVALWTPEGADALAGLRARGLTDETIRAAGLGWTPRADGVAWNPPGLVIPWRERGRLTLVKIRPDDAWREQFPEARRPPKYLEAFRYRSALYQAAPVRPGLPVIVTEGELDCLLVGQEAGEWAGVVTRGAASGKPAPSLVSDLAAATRWIIATDADEAGDKAAADWTDLSPARCVRARPEGVKDWTDLERSNPGAVRCLFARLAGGPDALWSVLENKRWGPALLPEDDPDRDRDEPPGILAVA